MKSDVPSAAISCLAAAVMALTTGCSSDGHTSEPVPEAGATATVQETPDRAEKTSPNEENTPLIPAEILEGMEFAPDDALEAFDDGSVGAQLGDGPALDDASKASALETATTVMQLFARPDIPDEQWLQELVPHLTFDAVQMYQYVDPQNVPVREVTGEASITPGSSGLVARVNVPTDIGGYLVILARDENHPNWEADRLIPPETVSGF